MNNDLFNSHENYVQRFQERTTSWGKTAGVQFPTFVCKCCGQRRTVIGRKMIEPPYAKAGYKCADCAEGKT